MKASLLQTGFFGWQPVQEKYNSEFKSCKGNKNRKCLPAEPTGLPYLIVNTGKCCDQQIGNGYQVIRSIKLIICKYILFFFNTTYLAKHVLYIDEQNIVTQNQNWNFIVQWNLGSGI